MYLVMGLLHLSIRYLARSPDPVFLLVVTLVRIQASLLEVRVSPVVTVAVAEDDTLAAATVEVTLVGVAATGADASEEDGVAVVVGEEAGLGAGVVDGAGLGGAWDLAVVQIQLC